MARNQSRNLFSEPAASDVHVDAPLGGKKSKKALTSQFLAKLYDEIKSAGASLSQADFQSAVKKSRSHAGGKMKAANRALMAQEPSDADMHSSICVMAYLNAGLATQIAMPGGEAPEDLHITLCYLGDAEMYTAMEIARILTGVEDCARWARPLAGKLSGVGRFDTEDPEPDVIYASPDIPGLAELRQQIVGRLCGIGFESPSEHGWDPHITLAYVDESTPTPDPEIGGTPIRIDSICVAIGDERTTIALGVGLMMSEHNVLDLAAQSHGFRLFNEFACAEPPARMPLMPKPSTHKHSAYGDVVITKERNERFAQNINEHVYQEKIPVDLEHQLKLSGAAGYITNAEVNADGSVDGLVEWTDLGREAIEKDRYQYVSPEWYDSWTHPMSEETFSDVVIGAALTTRPFFKESSLRPLIASEAGLQFGDVPKVTEKEIIFHFTALAPVSKGESMATKAQIEAARALVKAADAKTAGEATEDQITAARAIVTAEDARIAEEKDPPKAATEVAPTAQQFTELQSQLKQATEAAKQANDRAAVIEKDNRAMKFGETVKDWPGDKAKNIAVLEHLFSTNDQGVESEMFKAHVETMSATAAQLKAAGMFNEMGSASASDATGAVAKINAEVTKVFSESGGKLTKEQAFEQVWTATPPGVRDAYRQEQRSVN